MPTSPRTYKVNPVRPSAGAVVTEYLTAYLSGDIARAQSMVSADFSFRAPLIEVTATKDVFFAGSDRKAGYIRAFRILRQWESDDEVSTLYEIDVETSAGTASLLMHEWHTISAGQIASSVMLFDTAASAAMLLHDALAAPST
ncbi:MAG: hypothetical protein ACRDYY_01005 [Acidimicrobiales bacterium]